MDAVCGLDREAHDPAAANLAGCEDIGERGDRDFRVGVYGLEGQDRAGHNGHAVEVRHSEREPRRAHRIAVLIGERQRQLDGEAGGKGLHHA